MDTMRKICICRNPTIPPVPSGFKGTVICSSCSGAIKLPLEKDIYKGNDKVEEYLFYANKNNTNVNYEKVNLEMLLRIESALITLIDLLTPEKE